MDAKELFKWKNNLTESITIQFFDFLVCQIVQSVLDDATSLLSELFDEFTFTVVLDQSKWSKNLWNHL